ncbi:hypothetical protein CHS0354_019136 [Potamilus streckersoni]|uniref:Uncharacterized protein n=1 Tax=Potamilus streckersoni TaxID=2493646 RepID=A0AAE0W5F8_9BIVA|nr:hypothetical protein CHS0354_019136 [Potamilus streckersoni]
MVFSCTSASPSISRVPTIVPVFLRSPCPRIIKARLPLQAASRHQSGPRHSRAPPPKHFNVSNASVSRGLDVTELYQL